MRLLQLLLTLSQVFLQLLIYIFKLLIIHQRLLRLRSFHLMVKTILSLQCLLWEFSKRTSDLFIIQFIMNYTIFSFILMGRFCVQNLIESLLFLVHWFLNITHSVMKKLVFNFDLDHFVNLLSDELAKVNYFVAIGVGVFDV